MNNPRILDAGIVICKALMAIAALFFLAATIVLVHLNTVPELYEGVHFKGVFTSPGILNVNSIDEYTVDGEEPGDAFALSKIDSFSLFVNYIQVSVFLLFVVLILRQLIVVIRSVQEQNILVRSQAFRKVAHYSLVIFIVTSFTWVDSARGHYNSTNIRFTPMVLVVVVYILSNMLRKKSMRVEAERAGA
jgi:hypothetical protein